MLGENHPDFAVHLTNLAALYRSMGDDASALPLCRQAMETTRATLGENHPDFALCLNNLAALYRSMGDDASALPLFRQALEIWRATLGENHPYYANGLDNVALLYGSMGDYASALPLCRQALEIRRATLGEDHPEFAKSLHNLAPLLIAMNREQDALTLMQDAAVIDDRMIGQVFSIGSGHQRAAFLPTPASRMHKFLSLVLNHLSQSDEAVRAALDLVLRRKALLAEGSAAQRDALLGGRYPHLQPRFRELQGLRVKIVQKTLAGPGPEGAPAHLRQLADWVVRRDDLEGRLACQVPEMNLE
jgi:tetratricopeptide (TPR) repeat protein